VVVVERRLQNEVGDILAERIKLRYCFGCFPVQEGIAESILVTKNSAGVEMVPPQRATVEEIP
jgi:hypothetical protein